MRGRSDRDEKTGWAYSRFERWLPYVAAVMLLGLLTLSVLNWTVFQEDVDDTTAANRQAIQRSCDILNDAIVKSQEGQGNEATRILIAAILDGKPEVKRAWLKAVEESPPVLPTINCRRVANDPSYRPYAKKKRRLTP
jgi:hypothetical protein